MLKLVRENIGKYSVTTIATLIFMVGEVFFEILVPFIAAQIIDKGILCNSMDAVFFYGIQMLVCAFIALACGILAGITAANASAGLAANVRLRVFKKIQDFSFSNIDKFSSAGLITRTTTDITNIQNAFMMIIRICVRSPLMLICSIGMCFAINAQISFILLGIIVVIGIFYVFIIAKVGPIFRKVFDSYDKLNLSTKENITSIRVVKGFAREEFEKEKFGKAAKLLYDLSIWAEKYIALNMPALLTVIFGAILTLAWFGAQNIIAGEMSAGSLVSIFSYIMSMMMAIMMICIVFVMVSMSTASVRRINEVLKENPEQKNPEAYEKTAITEIPDGSIDFENVHFAYRSSMGAVTLWDINLHINPGQTIGIIGITGSGKSTLVNLIPRLYDTNKGVVKVGGHNVKDYNMTSLRNNVSMVLQNNVLFSGTILENLRWSKPDATLEECKQACKYACVDDFIEKLPDGYNTYIEQGGTNVSGGQRQRLCIARALMKSPKILILDDSTSAVDTATEAKIRDSFHKKIPNTTKIIISQRISSVQDADKIIVMKHGRIDAFDTHENLLQTNEIYRTTFKAQTESGGDFDEHAE